MYQVKILESVKKELKKLDRQTVRIIKNWIVKKLMTVEDPRIYGKPLKGKLKGIWRYRVGDWRLFATIDDGKMIIFLFEIRHRKEIYRNKN